MTKIEIPDTWHSDVIALGLGDAAQAAFIRLLAWSASARTDGDLPRAAVRAALVSAGSMAAMVDAGLAAVTPTGWRVVEPAGTCSSRPPAGRRRRPGSGATSPAGGSHQRWHQRWHERSQNDRRSRSRSR